jgi:chromosome partitioning protein
VSLTIPSMTAARSAPERRHRLTANTIIGPGSRARRHRAGTRHAVPAGSRLVSAIGLAGSRIHAPGPWFVTASADDSGAGRHSHAAVGALGVSALDTPHAAVLAEPQRPRRRDRAVVVCFANQSGGSGKTTSATSIARRLTLLGHRVLLVDLDPQHDACHLFGYEYPDQLCGACGELFKLDERDRPTGECSAAPSHVPYPTMFDVLINGNFDLPEATVPALLAAEVPIENLTIALSSGLLAGADKNFASMIGAETRLDRALEKARGEYDYILIDSPASLGTLMVNILVASDSVIACVKPGYKEIKAIEELLRTISTVNQALRRGLTQLALGGVLVVDLPGSGRLYQDSAKLVEEDYPGLALPNVPRTIRVPEAFAQQVVLPDWAPRSAAYAAYVKIVDRLFERGVL